MALPKKLEAFLRESGKKFELIEHRTVYTAFDAAATMQVPLSEVVKVLLIKTDKPIHGFQKSFVLACLAANRNIDFSKLARAVNLYIQRVTPQGDRLVRVKKVEIPKENVMAKVFKVSPGSMHPYGPVYKVPVCVDRSVMKQAYGYFPGGSFTLSIKMKTADFVLLTAAHIGSFTVAKKVKRGKAHKK